MKKQGMKKYLPTILIIAAIVVVIGFVVYAMTRSDSTGTTASQPATAEDVAAISQGHTTGNANAKVVVTEFGDYQCPVCGTWHPYLLNTFLPQYQDKVAFVFKNFPLTQVHKNAQISAQAAEAAGLQGKFWEMHNKLYETQTEWSELSDPSGKFADYAGQIGINVNQFKSDLNSQKVKDIVQKDVDLATKLNLQGTPTFFINGNQVTIKTGFEDLKNAVDQALAQTK